MAKTNPGEAKATEMQRAFNRAFRRIKKEPALTAAGSDAGFIDDPREPGSMRKKKGKRHGYQVIVRLVKYSDEKLAKDELSGGLHAEF